MISLCPVMHFVPVWFSRPSKCACSLCTCQPMNMCICNAHPFSELHVTPIWTLESTHASTVVHSPLNFGRSYVHLAIVRSCHLGTRRPYCMQNIKFAYHMICMGNTCAIPPHIFLCHQLHLHEASLSTLPNSHTTHIWPGSGAYSHSRSSIALY